MSEAQSMTRVFLVLAALAVWSCSSDEPGSSDTGADAADDSGAIDAGQDADATSDAGDRAPDEDADSGADATPVEHPVTEPGPYGVGYRETHLTYQPEGVEGERTIRVVMWYPTLDETGYDTRYLGLVVRPGVLTDAEPAPVEDPPVFVFSHGSNGIAEQTYVTMEFFASHGWLVLAPDHTGNTFVELGDPLPPEIFFLRPQDISVVLDFAYGLLTAEPPLVTPGDDVLVGGHSFGGYTTLAVAGAGFAVDDIVDGCELGGLSEPLCDAVTPEVEALLRDGFLDPRVDVAVPMAPGAAVVFSADGLASVDVPVLLFTGALDTMTPNDTEGDAFWAGLDGPDDIRIDFATAGHMSFTSLCDDLPPDLLEQGCGEGYIDPDELAFVVDAYSLAFARHHLWGDDADLDLLDGSRTLSDDVTFSTHEP